MFYYPTQNLQRVIISAMQIRTVRLRWKTMAGAALKTPNNFVVCGQKYKVLLLVFLVRMSGTLSGVTTYVIAGVL